MRQVWKLAPAATGVVDEFSLHGGKSPMNETGSCWLPPWSIPWMASEVPSTSIESGPRLVTVTVAYCGTAPFGAPETSMPLRSALDPLRIDATVIFSVRGLPLPEEVRGV